MTYLFGEIHCVNLYQIIRLKGNNSHNENYIFGSTSKTIVLSANEIDYTKKIGKQIADFLFENEIQSVIIEGGKQTLQTFIDENLWDEARIFRGNLLIENGVKAPDLHSKEIIRKSIIEDELLIFRNHD